jgi:hypothetical protein
MLQAPGVWNTVTFCEQPVIGHWLTNQRVTVSVSSAMASPGSMCTLAQQRRSQTKELQARPLCQLLSTALLAPPHGQSRWFTSR